mmetsp:Transcript_79125/g.223706  ORF Transcript_79125/g.223706 Transcript_79125/m.223706 type:complete len:213 (-) Transcript_79125:407-1045(-)
MGAHPPGGRALLRGPDGPLAVHPARAPARLGPREPDHPGVQHPAVGGHGRLGGGPLHGAEGAAPPHERGAGGPEPRWPADGVGGVDPVPREVLPEADDPRHGRPQAAELVPSVLRHEHGMAGPVRLLRRRGLRWHPRRLRHFRHRARLHSRGRWHVLSERLLRDGRCAQGQGEHGGRQRFGGQRAERVPGTRSALGHPDVVHQGWALLPGGP